MKVIFLLVPSGSKDVELSSFFTLFTFSSQIFRCISMYLAHHFAFHKPAVYTKFLTQVLQKKTPFWLCCLCLYNVYCVMQKLLEVGGISEPTASASASATFIFEFMLATSQSFPSSYYNFCIFCVMWNWALSRLSLKWFFPTGRTQQLLWHLAVEKSDGWHLWCVERSDGDCRMPFLVFPCGFFVCLPVKDCWDMFSCVEITRHRWAQLF